MIVLLLLISYSLSDAPQAPPTPQCLSCAPQVPMPIPCWICGGDVGNGDGP
jgi:hypothetical protein